MVAAMQSHQRCPVISVRVPDGCKASYLAHWCPREYRWSGKGPARDRGTCEISCSCKYGKLKVCLKIMY